MINDSLIMYQPQNFSHLLGLTGLSDALLTNHFKLYEGYVTNFNKLNDTLVAMEKEGQFGTQAFAELNRRLGWEWNGMRLHELYFGNMIKGGNILPEDSELRKKIVTEWGSFEMWEKDFRAMGAMRGIGWVVLYYDKNHNKARINADGETRMHADGKNADGADRLFNVWVNEHDTGHLAGATPLLVMDVFEHAFALDYGLNRAGYIDAFMAAIDWRVAGGRLTK